MRRTIIGAIIPNIIDSTSLYRGIGPLSALQRDCPDVFIKPLTQINWAELAQVDMVFMQRPYKQEHFTVVEMTHLQKKKVWVDYDDDLFTVPPSNPTHSLYGQERTKVAVAKIIAAADVVTVSTPHLKHRLQIPGNILNQNVIVVPNAFDDFLIKWQPYQEKRNNLVFWRGSRTHDEDMMAYAEPIIRLNQMYREWTWHFQGSAPWFVTCRLGHNARVAEAVDPMEYFNEFLRVIKPKVSIVPLADSPFNRSKSNIAWLEGIYAGAVSLVPDWEEWQRPGTVHYKNPAEFESNLRKMIEGSIGLDALLKDGRSYIEDKLMLSKVNKTRLEVLTSLQ